jgi:hypothetical protein
MFEFHRVFLVNHLKVVSQKIMNSNIYIGESSLDADIIECRPNSLELFSGFKNYDLNLKIERETILLVKVLTFIVSSFCVKYHYTPTRLFSLSR